MNCLRFWLYFRVFLRCKIAAMPRPALVEKAITSLLSSPGETAIALRQAVFERQRSGRDELPENLAPLMEKIADRPWSVDDEDIRLLLQAGYSEDQLLEVILAAATGAGVRRLDAGLRALEEAE